MIKVLMILKTCFSDPQKIFVNVVNDIKFNNIKASDGNYILFTFKEHMYNKN